MTAGALENAFRLADRGAPSPRSVERTLLAWFKTAASWVRGQVSDARGTTPAVLATRLRVGRGMPRPPEATVLRAISRPALRAAVRGELGVLRAAGVPLAGIERRLLPLVRAPRRPSGTARADAAPRTAPRARLALGVSGTVDAWSAGPGLRVLDDWSRVVRAHTQELSEGYVRALVKAIGEGIARGGEWEQIAEAVEAVSERFGDRVRLLARNEIASLTSAVTRELQTQAGITHFRWVHRGDDRVRKSHRAAGDGVFPWSKGAPGVGLYGEHGYPGQIRNCRCKARPVLPNEPDGAA